MRSLTLWQIETIPWFVFFFYWVITAMRVKRTKAQETSGTRLATIAVMIVAYEPVWAIGTGRNATAAQAGDAHSHIRRRLRQWFGGEAAGKCRVIYGGSVKPDNIASLIAEPDVDGALVGGASLDVRSFGEIVARSVPAAI